MVLLVFIAVSLLQYVECAPNLLVNTSFGQVLGHLNEVGIREWKGLPYAKPPIGELRWEYPVEPTAIPQGQIYEANFDAPGCSQTCSLPPGNCPSYGISEDCLYLSVYAPTVPSTDKDGYPVLLWIHGGAFEQGLGNCALYNGSTFAQKGIVSVVINYRLGALGFMASPSMKGNYGIADQRAAMKWVVENVKGFGGNPAAITLAGQSAGAMSVGIHLVSPNSQGLFQQGILESNPLALPYHTRDSAAINAAAVFTYLNCAADDVACMRSKSPEEVLDAQNNAVKLDLNTILLNFLPFAPMVEPEGEIPEQPLTAMEKGEMTAMPILSGTMYDEGQLFVYELFPKALSESEYKVIVEGVFGVKPSVRILKMYPFNIVANNTDGRNALNVLATDLLFYCPLRNITRGYSSVLGTSKAPTYTYRFKHKISFDCWGPDYTFCVGSVCHGSELPFVFNVFSSGDISYDPSSDEITLSTDLSNAWTNFITSGNPNTGLSIPSKYPQYFTTADVVAILDEPDFDTQTHVRDSFCDMWDQLGYFY
mmetsp:Transcript_33152/g.47959  ORF Transcript_33152/g.47959 Transcript_33152/m.47959 type:complete len:537 (+) Transcript_33152:31-1641(+)